MVESVSSKPVSLPDRQVAPVARTAAPAPVASGHQDTAAAELSLSAAAFGFGGAAPVDHDRVTQLRKAIQDGSYTIQPDKVADRLLAAKAEWGSK